MRRNVGVELSKRSLNMGSSTRENVAGATSRPKRAAQLATFADLCSRHTDTNYQCFIEQNRPLSDLLPERRTLDQLHHRARISGQDVEQKVQDELNRIMILVLLASACRGTGYRR